MFEIDKSRFGDFVTCLRKEKGYTQKELAEKLFVSDKAVSKWERGLGMPDITLLKPLSDTLGVSVTELLECRRIEKDEQINTGRVDEIVSKVIMLSDEDIRAQKARRKKAALELAASMLICCVEIGFILLIGIPFDALLEENIFLPLGLALGFGAWFVFGAKGRLPAYYDENRISAYSDGVFRMNMPGICFNNNNWSHIVRAGQLYAMTIFVVYPLFALVVNLLFEGAAAMVISYAVGLTASLAGLFVPIYIAAKKYE